MFSSLPSRGFHHVGVVQQIVPGDLLDGLAGANHHPGQARFDVAPMPRQRRLIVGEPPQLGDGIATVDVEESSGVDLGPGVEHPAVGRPQHPQLQQCVHSQQRGRHAVVIRQVILVHPGPRRGIRATGQPPLLPGATRKAHQSGEQRSRPAHDGLSVWSFRGAAEPGDFVTELLDGQPLHRWSSGVVRRIGRRLTCVVALHESQFAGPAEPVVRRDRGQVWRFGS